jgi:hypothetical protein
MLNYKIDGHADNYRAYSLFDDWEDGKGTLEELFKNESKSVITAAFNQYPGACNSHEYVESLLRLGADPNYTDCDEYSLLELVMIQKCEKTLRTLLTYSPEMKLRKYIYDSAIKKGGIWGDVAKRCEVFDDGSDF